MNTTDFQLIHFEMYTPHLYHVHYDELHRKTSTLYYPLSKGVIMATITCERSGSERSSAPPSVESTTANLEPNKHLSSSSPLTRVNIKNEERQVALWFTVLLMCDGARQCFT